ncbi:hypothetical protein FGO68_gene14062 [Halteria grandinella]|uniref:Uncharacterized protein n=1 Tax=Halteria grandinella TaxID=5974 RepID=A0A8J8T8I1_HALGN|nr:hypothetical protein FGO68_gene14062 [Halteria grandinella]
MRLIGNSFLVYLQFSQHVLVLQYQLDLFSFLFVTIPLPPPFRRGPNGTESHFGLPLLRIMLEYAPGDSPPSPFQVCL